MLTPNVTDNIQEIGTSEIPKGFMRLIAKAPSVFDKKFLTTTAENAFAAEKSGKFS